MSTAPRSHSRGIGRGKILCRAYIPACSPVSISYGGRSHLRDERRVSMLDFVLFASFAAVCLYIGYERLTRRI